jgi:Protein of unknown function (DUF3303)
VADAEKPDLSSISRTGRRIRGYAVLETDKPADLHKLTTVFAVFQFRVEPVLDVMDAVAAESEAIAWRDSIAA